MPATPIETIHVSQRGGYGRTLLTAAEAGLPALGYVVRYGNLQNARGEALAASTAQVLNGAAVERIAQGDGSTLAYRHGDRLLEARTRLLVIADGGASLGARAGAVFRTRDYGQEAVVGLIATSHPHAQVAYERFTPDGPVALLPFEDRYALVWTATPQRAGQLCALADRDFTSRLQAHFGDRAGRFLSVTARARFPLALRYAKDPVLPRTVLLGNAAQTLHPIAGQGFNLGLRDAWELAATLLRYREADPGSPALLDRYRSTRRLDRIGGIALTDSLVRFFSNDFPPLRAARGAGLVLLDVVPPAKRAFMQRMIFGGAL